MSICNQDRLDGAGCDVLLFCFHHKRVPEQCVLSEIDAAADIQVREDVERYGEMIEKLADTIKRERPADMPALMAFVQHADGQLAQLSDEHATLKFFEWPEAKYDCFREASALCHELWTLKVRRGSV